MKTIGKHPFIIEYIEFGKEFNRINYDGQTRKIKYLAIEYAENKSLLDFINSKYK
jgi:hypothetical protein